MASRRDDVEATARAFIKREFPALIEDRDDTELVATLGALIRAERRRAVRKVQAAFEYSEHDWTNVNKACAAILGPRRKDKS